MKTSIFHAYNMDSCCAELKFTDGSMIVVDTIAVENKVSSICMNSQNWTI